MRKALGGKVNPVAVSAVAKSAVAPVGGLNSRDALGAMKDSDALILENFICRPTSVELRPGQEDFVTGFAIGETVWAMMPYRDGVADKLFAATDTGIYDVTAAGVVGAAVTGCTSGRWESLNSVNAGVRYLLAVNGVDPMKFYNGTAWADAAVTGVDSSTFTTISQFKFRAFLTVEGSLSFWYLAVNAVQGAATEFPLGPLFKKGGALLASASWTVDGGQGLDDLAVFITTEGEVAVYQGTDPSTADTWALVGVYTLPRPVGKKCLFKYGGDLLVITESGLVELSKSLQSVTVDKAATVSDKNMGNITAATKAYKGNFGWELTLLSNENLLILNVPVVEGVTSVQYVMNTLTGAWSSFRAMDATCFVELGARLFYGKSQKVVYALAGDADFGNNIAAFAKTSYNFFGSRVMKKHIKMLKPNLILSKQTTLSLALSAEYSPFDYITQSSATANGLSLWDVSLWDQAVWSGGAFSDTRWRTVAQALGACIATLLQYNDKGMTLSWNSTDYLIEAGGPV